MKISIGNDHAGPEYKKAIVTFLESNGFEIINHGTDTFDSVDYPDFGHKVAVDVENETDRKSTHLNSSHSIASRMPSSA